MPSFIKMSQEGVCLNMRIIIPFVSPTFIFAHSVIQLISLQVWNKFFNRSDPNILKHNIFNHKWYVMLAQSKLMQNSITPLFAFCASRRTQSLRAEKASSMQASGSAEVATRDYGSNRISQKLLFRKSGNLACNTAANPSSDFKRIQISQCFVVRFTEIFSRLHHLFAQHPDKVFTYVLRHCGVCLHRRRNYAPAITRIAYRCDHVEHHIPYGYQKELEGWHRRLRFQFCSSQEFNVRG